MSDEPSLPQTTPLPLVTTNDTKYLHTYWEPSESKFITVHLMTGERIGELVKPNSDYVFSEGLAHHICNLIREGSSIEQVLNRPSMPARPVFNKWMRSIDGFADLVNAAIQDRADIYHDKVLAIADDWENIGKESAPAAKMAIDAYKWAASVGDGRKFNAATSKGDSVAMPNITIKIDTGSKELDNMTYELSDNGELKGFEYVTVRETIRGSGAADSGSEQVASPSDSGEGEEG